jgi:hypothetical protein
VKTVKNKGRVMARIVDGIGKLTTRMGNKDTSSNRGTSEKNEWRYEPTELDTDRQEKNRNYKNEANWEKEKYKQFNLKINRELGEAFAAKLAQNNVKLADWFRECINTYMSK